MPPIDFRKLGCCILDACNCVFGEPVKYVTRDKSKSFKLRGIFDERFEQVDPDIERIIASQQPMLGIKTKDLPFPACKGDFVIIRKKHYVIHDVQEDGIAGATLMLHEANIG